MDQDLGAQCLVQDIGAAGEQQAQVIGQEAVVGGAIAGQVVFHLFDEILILAARTVDRRVTLR